MIVLLNRKYNVGLPASAAVERLFSQSGLIFTDKRNGLTDQHFEMSVFLKVNKHVFDKW